MSSDELFEVVSVRGQDALPFLQSLFAADLSSVSDGRLRWTALLNPQGRVLHVVAAVRCATDDWRLLVPFARGAELVDGLRRFVFRRKVVLAIEPNLTVTSGDDHGMTTGIDDLSLKLNDRGCGSALSIAALDVFVGAGLALIDRMASGRHLAHALRLDRFEAFSVKKGCYPGQEIVARTHFLGRNKRILVELGTLDGPPPAAGDKLFLGDTEVGELACSGPTRALAVLTADVTIGQVLGDQRSTNRMRVIRSFSS